MCEFQIGDKVRLTSEYLDSVYPPGGKPQDRNPGTVTKHWYEPAQVSVDFHDGFPPVPVFPDFLELIE